MLAANTYNIRPATSADRPLLRRLAYLDRRRPPAGAALIAEAGRVPFAAVCLHSGRIMADPAAPAGMHLALWLRLHALRAAQRTPVLSERLRAGVRLAVA
jgi:hypothetical protein